MPQLILLAVVGAIAWVGYKRFIAEADRVNARVREAEREKKTGAQGTLVQDPETGEYRLRKPEE
jgi:membrane protein implicated in regulation of membrane protease activity